MPSRLLVNDRVSVVPGSGPGPEVRELHRRLPGYAPTPLVDMSDLAAAYGVERNPTTQWRRHGRRRHQGGQGRVGRVVVKAEVERFGLPSFKALGASWATYRLLCQRLGAEPEWTNLDELAAVIAAELGPLRLVAATDGNHGRAVAYMARRLGLESTILVPAGTAAARIEGIASEGAAVVVVEGTYDDAVAESAAMASDTTVVVSDTSWPGYEDPPRWVIDGYSTIFAELAEQLPLLGVHQLDVVVVPLGVGALGAAAAVNLRGGRAVSEAPVLIGVEPETAACVAAAVAAGEPVEVPGPHRSIMAGLNCGLASPLALPFVSAGFTAFVAVDDDRCRDAVRALADAGLDVGETGAAALAGLTALVDEQEDELPLGPDATVLLLATEGVTDPAGFEAIVGRAPIATR